jgi:hypothetical protein
VPAAAISRPVSAHGRAPARVAAGITNGLPRHQCTMAAPDGPAHTCPFSGV